jgi:hypothetical protein
MRDAQHNLGAPVSPVGRQLVGDLKTKAPRVSKCCTAMRPSSTDLGSRAVAEQEHSTKIVSHELRGGYEAGQEVGGERLDVAHDDGADNAGRERNAGGAVGKDLGLNSPT